MREYKGTSMITSGSVIRRSLPHAEHSEKPFGGIGEITGAGVGAIGAGVVGAVVGPIGEQPQGAAKVERAGQKAGSMKPLKPKRSKLRHDMGKFPGIVSITLGSVISSPAPHTEHSGKLGDGGRGKSGDGGIGEAMGTGAGVGAIGAGVVGTKGVPPGAQPQGARMSARIGQKSGSMKPKRPAR